jgi:hypothetical protein
LTFGSLSPPIAGFPEGRKVQLPDRAPSQRAAHKSVFSSLFRFSPQTFLQSNEPPDTGFPLPTDTHLD